MKIYDAKQTRVLSKKASERHIRKKVFFWLRKNGWTVSLAESCTGGLLSASLTAKPGSSEFFKGSIVCYSNAVKTHMLNVPDTIIQKEGAVSPGAVREMCWQACRIFHSEAAVAVSGIAGPSGGSREKPVGTVWIGVCVQDQVHVFGFLFSGNRKRIRNLAVRMALSVLADCLEEAAG